MKPSAFSFMVRLGFDCLFLMTVWWLPWWLVLGVWCVASLRVPHFYEGLFFMTLYEAWLVPAGYSWPYYTLGASLLLLTIEIVRASLYNGERVSHI